MCNSSLQMFRSTKGTSLTPYNLRSQNRTRQVFRKLTIHNDPKGSITSFTRVEQDLVDADLQFSKHQTCNKTRNVIQTTLQSCNTVRPSYHVRIVSRLEDASPKLFQFHLSNEPKISIQRKCPKTVTNLQFKPLCFRKSGGKQSENILLSDTFPAYCNFIRTKL